MVPGEVPRRPRPPSSTVVVTGPGARPGSLEAVGRGTDARSLLAGLGQRTSNGQRPDPFGDRRRDPLARSWRTANWDAPGRPGRHDPDVL